MTLDFWDPLHEAWGNPAWPKHVREFRDHQKVAIAECMEHYANGIDVVLLNAPTGSGKTVIAEAVRRLLEVEHCLYVANTKGLQDQFARDFPYAAVLKGRANYSTADRPELFDKKAWQQLTAADCTKSWTELPACDHCMDVSTKPKPHCLHCHPVIACPYEQARDAATSAPLAVTNTAYFLTEANGPARFSSAEAKSLRPDQLVVVDECDTLEPVLMGLTELYLSKRQQGEYELEAPKVKGRDALSNDWMPWCTTVALPRVATLQRELERKWMHIQEGASGKEYLVWNPQVPTKVVRQAKTLQNLAERLHILTQDLEYENTIFDGYQRGDIRFKPIRVDRYGPSRVWRHAHRWLLMSATVIDPQEYVTSLGIEAAGLSWEMVNVPSTFPPEHRPIHVKGIANMTRAEKDTAWPAMAEGVARVIRHHPGVRILVHTVSYDLAADLIDRCKMCDGTRAPADYLTYKNAKERDVVLEVFRKHDAAVLFAPSMDRGVDLPEDDCRVVIVAKVPFPNLGDKQINARIYTRGGQLWYSVQTVRALVQMTGRAVRSNIDRCDIYILDKQFLGNVWSKSKRLLPEWWTESIDWSGGVLSSTARPAAQQSGGD